MKAFLSLKNLSLWFPGHLDSTHRNILKDVSLDVKTGEILGVVGESGSGKSLLMKFLLGLLPKNAQFNFDSFAFMGHEISGTEALSVRQKSAMILQDPKFSLNPVLTVKHQMEEALLHNEGNSEGILRKALESVSIDDPQRVLKSYPFELSGGMGQRVMIAMMLLRSPELLVADEPTSALDAQVRTQILDLLKDKARSYKMTLIMVSHDLLNTAKYADRILVMRNGRVVENIPSTQLKESKNPYTRGLLECLPNLPETRHRLPTLDLDTQR